MKRGVKEIGKKKKREKRIGSKGRTEKEIKWIDEKRK